MSQRFGVSPFRWNVVEGGFYAPEPWLDWWALEHGITAEERRLMREGAASAAQLERWQAHQALLGRDEDIP